MLNPILKNKKTLYYYLLIWAIISLVHWFILFYFYNVDVLLSFCDSFLFNSLFCGISLQYWYVVKYINVENTSPLTIVINHLVAACISIGIWIYGGNFFMKLIGRGNTDYLHFLNGTLPARFLIGMFLYSVIILLNYLFVYSNNLQEKMRNEGKLQTLVKEAELNTLKSQINPHFIFNSLNSISALTIIRPTQAREMIIKLSEFLRYALDQDMKEKTLLRNELENIKRYLEIEKIRFGERLRFDLSVASDVDKFLLPNMILQPLLENAIKHGVYESTEPISIDVQCLSENETLKIRIRNNYDPEVLVKKSTGIGLKNIYQRLQLIYNREDLIKINNTGKEFEVMLSFPQIA